MYPSIDALIARIALSLWTSDRATEPLPRVRTYSPREKVEIVAVPVHLSRALVSSRRFEGI